MLISLWRYRDLVVRLTRAQYRLRYRQSLLGFAWAIGPPLGLLGVGAFVFRGVDKVSTGGAPYAVVTLAATIPWALFSSGLGQALTSVVGAQPVVTRLSFPRAVLPLSQIGTSMVDLLVSMGVFVVFALAYGRGIPVTALWVPALVLLEFLLVFGMSLLGGALTVFARDFRLAVPLVTQLWLFVTPVMYPLSAVPHSLRGFALINPMTGLVESFRDVLVYGQQPRFGLLLSSLVGAGVAMALGVWYFGATEARFADVV